MPLDVIIDKNTIDKAKKHLMGPLDYYRSAYDYLGHEKDYDKVKCLLNDLLGSTIIINRSNVEIFKKTLSSLLRKRIALYEEILRCFDDESFVYLYLALALVRFSIDKINHRSENKKEKSDLIQHLKNDNKIFQKIEGLLLPLLPESSFIEIYTFLLSFSEVSSLKKIDIYLSKKTDPILAKMCFYITGAHINSKKRTTEKKEQHQESSASTPKTRGAEFAHRYQDFMRDLTETVNESGKISYGAYRNIFEHMIKFWPFLKEIKKSQNLLRVKDKYFEFIRELEKDLSAYTLKINYLQENINHYLKTTAKADFVTLTDISKIRTQAREHLEQLEIDKGEIYKTDLDKVDEQKLNEHKNKHLIELDTLIKRWEQLMYRLLPELNPEKSISIVLPPSEILDKPEIEMISTPVEEITSLSIIQEDKFTQKTFLWKKEVEEKRKEKKFKAIQNESSSSSSSSSSIAKMIESEDFSEIAFERISQLNHTKLELLNKIVNIEFGVCFEEVKNLVTTLDGKISNIGNGSSHYKISLCQYSKMIIKNEEDKSVGYQGSKRSEKSSIAKGSIVKPHGKSHSSGKLSNFNLGCVADVFYRAGITKEVVAKAMSPLKTESIMRLG